MIKPGGEAAETTAEELSLGLACAVGVFPGLAIFAGFFPPPINPPNIFWARPKRPPPPPGPPPPPPPPPGWCARFGTTWALGWAGLPT